MFSPLRSVASLVGAVLLAGGCASAGREGPPAPVVSVSSPQAATVAAVPVPTTRSAPEPAVQAAPRPAPPKKTETRVFAYREPGSEAPPVPAAAAPKPAPAAPKPASVAVKPTPGTTTKSGTATETAAKSKPTTPPAASKPEPARVATQTAAVKPKPDASRLASEPVAKPKSETARLASEPAVKPKTLPPESAKPKTSVQSATRVASDTARTTTRTAEADAPPPRPKPKPPTAVAAAKPPSPAREQSAPAEPPAPKAVKAPPAAAEKPAAPGLAPAADGLARQAEQQRQSGDYAGAAATLERSLRIAPREAYLWNRLARVRMEQGLTAQASQLASRSNDLAGSQSTVKKDNWRIIAESRRRAGDTAGAGEAEQRASGD